MDAGRSEPPSWWRAAAALGATERLAGLGALICGLATILPWYRAPVEDLVRTGLADFGFVTAAQLLTVAAALALLLQVGHDRRPPLPLHEGSLLALAGIWAGLMIVILMFDRPQFRLAGFDQDYSLAYGIFVSLGGAALLAVSGLRIRAAERSREWR